MEVKVKFRDVLKIAVEIGVHELRLHLIGSPREIVHASL
jgi:hypothetical protein